MNRLDRLYIEGTKDHPINGLRCEIRMDWNNDRHHTIPLKDGSPTEVVDALLSLAIEIRKDINEGNL